MMFILILVLVINNKPINYVFYGMILISIKNTYFVRSGNNTIDENSENFDWKTFISNRQILKNKCNNVILVNLDIKTNKFKNR